MDGPAEKKKAYKMPRTLVNRAKELDTSKLEVAQRLHDASLGEEQMTSRGRRSSMRQKRDWTSVRGLTPDL